MSNLSTLIPVALDEMEQKSKVRWSACSAQLGGRCDAADVELLQEGREADCDIAALHTAALYRSGRSPCRRRPTI